MKALVAALSIASAQPSTAVTARDPACPMLRAITNADGRNFADLRIALGRPLAVASPTGAILSPPPESCNLDLASDMISVSCTWRAGEFAALSGLFDTLATQLETCLAIDLPPASGPEALHNAQALRNTRGDFPMGGGTSKLRLLLVEAAGDAQFSIDPYHYVALWIEHGAGEPN